MTLYYLKFIAASSLFILFYYLFLEPQKNHHYKRYFLLGSLLIGVLIPILEIPFGTYEIQNKATDLTLTVVNSSITEVKASDWTLILTFL